MMDMMGGMWIVMLIVALLVAAIIGVAIYLAVRAGQGGRSPQAEPPRETLQRRLAAGEITPEEYYERESALREAEPRRRARG